MDTKVLFYNVEVDLGEVFIRMEGTVTITIYALRSLLNSFCTGSNSPVQSCHTCHPKKSEELKERVTENWKRNGKFGKELVLAWLKCRGGGYSWEVVPEFSKLYYSKKLLSKCFNYLEIRYLYSEDMLFSLILFSFFYSEIFLLNV